MPCLFYDCNYKTSGIFLNEFSPQTPGPHELEPLALQRTSLKILFIEPHWKNIVVLSSPFGITIRDMVFQYSSKEKRHRFSSQLLWLLQYSLSRKIIHKALYIGFQSRFLNDSSIRLKTERGFLWPCLSEWHVNLSCLYCFSWEGFLSLLSEILQSVTHWATLNTNFNQIFQWQNYINK